MCSSCCLGHFVYYSVQSSHSGDVLKLWCFSYMPSLQVLLVHQSVRINLSPLQHFLVDVRSASVRTLPLRANVVFLPCTGGQSITGGTGYW